MKKIIYILNLFLLVTTSISATTFIVNSTSDNTSSGTLRWAINQANSNPGADIISFNIPGIAPKIITLASSLPSITGIVTIDGNTQPANGYIGISKRVVIDGNNSFFFLININGVASSGSLITNLKLINSKQTPIYIDNSNNNSIIGNVINPMWGATRALVITASNTSPNAFTTANGNIIRGNIIGTDETLQISSAFVCMGIFLLSNGAAPLTYGEVNSNIIGGQNPGEGNLIYNTSSFGAITLGASTGHANFNLIQGNLFINNQINIMNGISNQSFYSNMAISPGAISGGNYISGFYVVSGTGGPANRYVEIYKSNSTGIDAVQLLGADYTGQNGVFNAVLVGANLVPGDKLIATWTDLQNNTSNFCTAYTNTQNNPNPIYNCLVSSISTNPASQNGVVCAGTVTFVSSCNTAGVSYLWNFGDGIVSTDVSPVHTYQSPGNYNVTCVLFNPSYPGSLSFNTSLQLVNCPQATCKTCIGSFAPDPGDYIVSLWVKEDNTNTNPPFVTSYNGSGLKVSFSPITGGSPISTVYTAFANSQNPIIDGWQRIETKINIPPAAYQMHVELLNNNSSGIDSYFDDIRIHPVDASMKSYVYDPITLRLSAELDENNYGTFYEYDEEGKLIRVKKETEKGVMTIKETRSANRKR
jgi:hypothetical protein